MIHRGSSRNPPVDRTGRALQFLDIRLLDHLTVDEARWRTAEQGFEDDPPKRTTSFRQLEGNLLTPMKGTHITNMTADVAGQILHM
jgi:hypothetical protein